MESEMPAAALVASQRYAAFRRDRELVSLPLYLLHLFHVGKGHGTWVAHWFRGFWTFGSKDVSFVHIQELCSLFKRVRDMISGKGAVASRWCQYCNRAVSLHLRPQTCLWTIMMIE